MVPGRLVMRVLHWAQGQQVQARSVARPVCYLRVVLRVACSGVSARQPARVLQAQVLAEAQAPVRVREQVPELARVWSVPARC